MSKNFSMQHKIYDSVVNALPDTLGGAIDYYVGHHSMFYPWGGPMNGQTARLEAVREVVFEVRPNLIVETGAYRGTTTQWLAELGPRVLSVELKKRYHEFTRRRLESKTNVTLSLGSSVGFLKRIAADPESRAGVVVFYIDSHWEEYLPLREEMETIFHNFKDFVAIIDDFRVEEDDGYTYDDYGAGKALTIDLIASCNLPGLSMFFPSVMGKHETGAKRGSVFVTASPAIRDKLCRLPLLRQWPSSG